VSASMRPTAKATGERPALASRRAVEDVLLGHEAGAAGELAPDDRAAVDGDGDGDGAPGRRGAPAAQGGQEGGLAVRRSWGP
jgi:hypothetical protein